MVTREIYDYSKGEYLEILGFRSNYLINYFKKDKLQATYRADNIIGDIGQPTEIWLDGKRVAKIKNELVSTFKLIS